MGAAIAVITAKAVPVVFVAIRMMFLPSYIRLLIVACLLSGTGYPVRGTMQASCEGFVTLGKSVR
jgi:hypothetical protein